MQNNLLPLSENGLSSQHSHDLHLSAATVDLPQKRRRVEIACSSCRHRKSRCDGLRPVCSSCTQFPSECVYEEASSPGKRHVGRSTYLDLTKRVKELESKLKSMSRALAKDGSTDSNKNSKDLPSTAALVDGTSSNDHQQKSTSVIDPDNQASQGETTEGQVDTLATAVFDDSPEPNIGHFGPSSNHRLFRTVCGIFARTTRIHLPSRQDEMNGPMKNYQTFTRPTSPIQVTLTQSENQRIKADQNSFDASDSLLDHHNVNKLIIEFFVTTGAVLPYICKSSVLSEYNSNVHQEKLTRLSRPRRALWSIICAHASVTLRRGRAAVSFYTQTLAFLDEKTLRGSSIPLVQALLLLCSFQQNNQRSIASWTYHAIAVKAAFQLGLHSLVSYEEYGVHECELRKRLWYAVINQDRYLSAALGRPCLIPQEHIRTKAPQDPRSVSHTMSVGNSSHINSLIYFSHMIDLHIIQGSTITSLYGHNIDTSDRIDIQELISKRFQLIWQLERWRKGVSNFCSLISDYDSNQPATTTSDSQRFQTLLSFHYHAMTLLINRPVLTTFLQENLDKEQDDREVRLLLEMIIPVIKSDFAAGKALQSIIQDASENGGLFLDCNATWWFANYTMLTVILHLFSILLICNRHGDIVVSGNINITEVRGTIDSSMQTFQAVERTSLMSRKARHCLRGLLTAFDSLAHNQQSLVSSSGNVQVTMPATATNFNVSFMPANDILTETDFSQYISQSVDDFLTEYTQNSFLDADMIAESDMGWI